MLQRLLHHRFGTLCRLGCLFLALCGSAVAVLPQTAHSITLGITTYTQGTDLATGFNFYSSTVSGGPYIRINVSPVPLGTGSPVAEVVFTAGVGGTKYFFVATAVDAIGSESAFSPEVSATFLANPAAPAGITAVAK